jgi:hypothetical protein
MAVTFDGPNKLIIVDFGITELDAKIDIYSDWKEWMQVSDNSKFLQALSTTGGDPVVPGTLDVAPYFFLTNSWKLRPHEADHELLIVGNLYGESGADMFVPTLGGYTVSVQVERSVNSLQVTTGGSSGGITVGQLVAVLEGLR